MAYEVRLNKIGATMGHRQQEQFRIAMGSVGLHFDGPVVADGKIHRFKVHGDHSPNSWYVFHDDEIAAGAYGCWKRDIKETWCERNGQLSAAEKNVVRQQWRGA